MKTLTEAARQTASLALDGTILVGANSIADMSARRGALRSAMGEQEAAERQAAREAEDAMQAARRAEAAHQGEADKLAGLRRADEAIGQRIEAKRREVARDREAQERAGREAERNRQRQIEDGLAALGRQEAERLARERTLARERLEPLPGDPPPAA